MDHSLEIRTLSIYVDVRPSSAFTQGYAFVGPTGGISSIPHSDFWLNIPLYRTHEPIDYVDVEKDNKIQKIERQEINPFYLEYAFFDGIQRNKVNNGNELTDAMVSFILSKRADIQGMTPEQVRDWFDNIGKNELPWPSVDGERTTASDIDRSQTMLKHIVSKANFLHININN